MNRSGAEISKRPATLFRYREAYPLKLKTPIIDFGNGTYYQPLNNIPGYVQDRNTYMQSIQTLLELIKGEPYLYIQTHDFPDHDAVATAFGMQYLLSEQGIQSYLIYEGSIQRDSLFRMAEELAISIDHVVDHSIHPDNKIILVDGCKGNKNVHKLPGEVLAVIDHHNSPAPEDVPFADIRPEYGACSTIIYTYLDELGLSIPRNTASALMIGLLVDTAHLSRGISEADITCHYNLYGRADIGLVNSILRNNIQKQDLQYYREVLNEVTIENQVAFYCFEDGCTQNLLGILSDFFLSIQEVNFVFFCAINEDKINLSVRSEKPEWDAAEILQTIQRGIVFGSGHQDIAGGVILDTSLFNIESCYQELKELLQLE